MDYLGLILIYIGILIVFYLHELGHLPDKIKFQFFPPQAAAMGARSQYGGLIVNVALFSLVYYLRPESVILQAIGLVSWAHFILYTFLGSIMPEYKNSAILDDVPNKYSYLFIPLSLLTFVMFKAYYYPIFLEILGLG